MENPFRCANGHSFTANAKIRARCPTCGAMARREFKEQKPANTEGEQQEPQNEQHKPIKEPVILRQGRTPVATAKKRTPAQLANDKRLSEMRKKATPPHKVANGLVTTKRAIKPSIPKVTKKPSRTAIAGQLRSLPAAKPKSFMDQVIDAFGFKIG
jgi:predicted  nucleic acid-binding Zn-ribbon protein